jgi:hypothetical protein
MTELTDETLLKIAADATGYGSIAPGEYECEGSAIEAYGSELITFGRAVETMAKAGVIDRLCHVLDALAHAEAALGDIGDADREPGDDLAWCEARAAVALPIVRNTLRAYGRRVGTLTGK